MRRIMSVTAAAGAVVMLSAALAVSTAAGGGVAVSAETTWSFGGVYVDEGATYDVVARGYVLTTFIPAYKDLPSFKSASGPEGQPGACIEEFQNTLNGECMLLGAPFGALIGVVIDGDTGWAVGDPFLIGGDTSFVAPATGWLFLSANDLNLTYYDNNGQFTVSVMPS